MLNWSNYLSAEVTHNYKCRDTAWKKYFYRWSYHVGRWTVNETTWITIPKPPKLVFWKLNCRKWVFSFEFWGQFSSVRFLENRYPTFSPGYAHPYRQLDTVTHHSHHMTYYLCHHLASGEGIVMLGIMLSCCCTVCVCLAVTARCISLGGKGNVLYPLLSTFTCYTPLFMKVKHLKMGSRSFSVSGPTVWNSLPDYLRNKPVGDMVRSLAAEKVLIFVQKGTWGIYRHTI